MKHHQPNAPSPETHFTQFCAIALHLPRYYVRTVSRLSEDSGVSKAALSRFLRAANAPAVSTVIKVKQALERALGAAIALEELIRLDPHFPRTACEICGCRGCDLRKMLNPDGSLAAEFGSGYSLIQTAIPQRRIQAKGGADD